MHRRPAAMLAGLLLVVAAACTSESDVPDLPNVTVPSGTAATQEPSAAPAEPDSPAPTVPSKTDGLGGRLAVLDEAGNLVTVNPDGSDEVVLAEIDPGQSQVRQPSWSPDGDRVAWVHLAVNEAGAIASSIATATGRGGRPTSSRTAVVPFYLSWDPTSTRIAYLASPAEQQIALGILELAGHSMGTALDTGEPFYLSWGPKGDQLLVHVGTRRLDRLNLDGSLETVIDRPGRFTAPVWTADGRNFVYASARSGHQRLVVQDAGASRGRSIVPFGELIAFVVSPDGTRVAFQPYEEAGPLPLTVIDVQTHETMQVTDHPTAAFFWSPDSERLLYLDPEPDQEQLWYRWGVWDGTTAFTTPRFVPSLLMVDEYLPFFEQYAQSMSLWSPDGKAFAYPGMSEGGETGIWIQSARSDRAPVLIAGGDFVAWSPV